MRFGAACAGSYVPMPAINENANKQFTSDLFFIRASYQCCLDQRRCFDARNTENLRQNSAPIARSCVNKHHRAIIGMLVSRKFGFLFVHIPKTAGISITRALEPLCEPRTETFLRRLSRHLPIREDVAKVCLPRHATAQWMQTKLGKDAFGALHSFAVVRHPLERVYSHYDFTRRRKEHHWHQRMQSASFADYLDYLASRSPARRLTQFDFVAGADGRMLVNSVLRFETIQDDFAAFCVKLGLPVLPNLGSHNRSPENTQRAEALADPKARKLVSDLYARDFVAFGYQS